jgi:hypothetical protein
VAPVGWQQLTGVQQSVRGLCTKKYLDPRVQARQNHPCPAFAVSRL